MRKPYVAVVDDDSAFASYLRTFLSLRGYETRSYSRGDELLAAVKQGDPPDIVLLDVMMPKMDGLQVASALRDDPTTRAIPILLLSAKAQATDVQAGKDVADDYITKPFDPLELLDRVSRLLG